MKKTIFTGSAVAIVTPMNADGSVNYEKFGQLIDFQIENDTDAIVVCGTTGESATLTHEEHCQCLQFATKHVAGRVPVIVGTGSNHTDYALALTKEAKEAGADAALMVTPYYNKASQSGLITHYNYIADRVDIPIILYNVPSRTGVNIKPQTYFELSKHPNIVATKEANGNLVSVMETINLCGDNLDIYSGSDEFIAPIMMLGGKGIISVMSNIMPKETHAIAAACLEGDCKKGGQLQMKYLDMINALFSDVNPIPVKEAMNLMGMEVGNCRLPLSPMEDGALQKLKDVMKKYGLI